jgi:hypothetical protein
MPGPNDEFTRAAAEYVAAGWQRVDGHPVPWEESVHSSFLLGLKRRLYAAMGGADAKSVTFRDGTRLTASVWPGAGAFRFGVKVEPAGTTLG